MKKVALCALLVFGLAFSSFAQEQTITAGWVSTPPTLDGVLSPGEWDGATMISFDSTDRVRPGISYTDAEVIGGPNGDGLQSYEDSHVNVYVMNDADNLYIAVDAIDDILDFSNVGGTSTQDFRSDSAQIRVDGNFSRSNPKENSHFGFNTNVMGDSGRLSSEQGDVEASGAAKPDGSGWIVEFRSSTEGFEPEVGFDVAINDSDDPNESLRDAQYAWNGESDAGWNDETYWGSLILATEPSKVQYWELLK